eukprot:3796223-Pyramimonas_sp.AAC.1
MFPEHLTLLYTTSKNHRSGGGRSSTSSTSERQRWHKLGKAWPNSQPTKKWKRRLRPHGIYTRISVQVHNIRTKVPTRNNTALIRVEPSRRATRKFKATDSSQYLAA